MIRIVYIAIKYQLKALKLLDMLIKLMYFETIT